MTRWEPVYIRGRWRAALVNVRTGKNVRVLFRFKSEAEASHACYELSSQAWLGGVA